MNVAKPICLMFSLGVISCAHAPQSAGSSPADSTSVEAVRQLEPEADEGAAQPATADPTVLTDECAGGNGDRSRLALSGCEGPSGWCREIRELAVNTWPYAQLAKNVYRDDQPFDVSQWFTAEGPSFEEPDLGFFAELFREKSTGRAVLVFRGTDNRPDWWHGNVRLDQQRHGLKVYDQVRAKEGPSSEIILVGHSLGGAIAMHVSLHRPHAKVYSFNGSPRFKAPKAQCQVNERFSIVEHGEVLKAIRAPFREATQLYTSLSCRSERGWRLLRKHSIRAFAECLTQIAATEAQAARDSLAAHGIRELYEREPAQAHAATSAKPAAPAPIAKEGT